MSLFLAYLNSTVGRRGGLRFPPRWSANKVAHFIYVRASMLSRVTSLRNRKQMVASMSSLLRFRGCVPLNVPAIKVPRQLFPQCCIPLRLHLHRKIGRLKLEAERRWLRTRVRITPAALARWSDAWNANRRTRDLSDVHLNTSASAVAEARVHPKIQALPGDWTLPRWPTPDWARSQL